MRIKKAAEAKHEATKTPATTEFLNEALSGSLLDLLQALRAYPRPWTEPRGDLYHWISLLNAFDLILSEFNSSYKLTEGPQRQPFGDKMLRNGVQDSVHQIDVKGVGSEAILQSAEDDESLILAVLDFGRLLLDNCANRTLYNSSEHVEPLLNSTSSTVVVSALHLGSRFAATYYRSNHHRPATRQSFNSTLLQLHYRINTDRVQKLAEPFPLHDFKPDEAVSTAPQTPSGKGKELGQNTRLKPSTSQAQKVNPSDLLFFVHANDGQSAEFIKYGGVELELDANRDSNTRRGNGDPRSDRSDSQPPGTPTPAARRPSRLSRTLTSDDGSDATEMSDRQNAASTGAHTDSTLLTIPPQEVKDTGLAQLIDTYIPRISKPDSEFAFLTNARFAKSIMQDAEARRRCVAVRILALTNMAFLYSEQSFTQKILQPDSQQPREMQLVQQLAELIKPAEREVPAYLRAIALEALEAISIKHRSRHADICSALGINVNHGVIFQLLREVDQDLRSEQPLDAPMLDKHERVFNLLDSLRDMNLASRTARWPTMDALVAAGLFNILVEILGIRSEKAQHAQNRAILFVHEGSRQARDGIRIFANASGLDTLSELIAWEVKTCLDAVANGTGLSPRIKSKVMDYSVPIWHQQTLRTALKFVNHLLTQQAGHVERLLRNLIDSPHFLKSIYDLVLNSKIFGSNIYANTISMVSTFIHNEPTSYAVIQEAGISRGLLDSITSSSDDTSASPSAPTRRLPIKKVDDGSVVSCGSGSEAEQVNLARSNETALAGNILCSTDVLLNLPHAFGALCLTSQGLNLFLESCALESYFEVFESPTHVKTIASEKDLATFIGNAFDELVRHHPDLRTAVLRCFILTAARLARKCSGMNLDPSAEIESRSGDVAMTDADRSINIHEALAFNSDDVDAATLITIFCRFINGFFQNQQMAASFLRNGGLPFILDLCSIPTLPFNFVNDPGYDNSFDLTRTIHILAEAQPGQAMPLVLAEAQTAIDTALSSAEEAESYDLFKKIVTGAAFDPRAARKVAVAFTRGMLWVNVLQEMLNHHIFPHARERAWSPLTVVNATDMWVKLITRAGMLSRFCTWEAVCLLDGASTKLEAGTRDKGNGIGPEANKVLGVSLNLSSVNATISGSDFVFPPDSETEDSAIVDADNEPASGAGERISVNVVSNTRIIRHLLVTIPNAVSAFYLNVGIKAVTKRMRDYARQNMFLIVEAVAKSVVSHLRYQRPLESGQQGHLLAYDVVVLDMIRRVLNINEADNGPAAHFITLLFVALRNNDAFSDLNQLLLDTKVVVLADTDQPESPPTVGETKTDILNCARSVTHIILTLYGCLASSKFTADSSQSMALAAGPQDVTSQFSFSPQQLLLESRAAILPAVTQIWETDGAERLPSRDLRKIIRLLRIILEADNESTKHNKRQSEVPLKQQAKHRTFSINSRSLRPLQTGHNPDGETWDRDMLIEALYRCNNDVDMARDYLEARHCLDYPRFPPPLYDLDLQSTKPPPSPTRRDSQATVPDQETDHDAAMRIVADLNTQIGTAPPEQSQQASETTPNLATAGTAGTETDDDGRMAMSIDNVLNITEREQSESRQAASASAKQQTELDDPATVGPSTPPIELALFRKQISIEDLDSIRNPLRGQLITRVMDILGVHDNMTVDLAELLSTAASKAKDKELAQQTKEELGETLVQALVSFRIMDDFREKKKNIAACANLLARLMQEKEFYEACSHTLFNNGAIEDLLHFVRIFPNTPSEEGHPWIGHVLLIFEKLLSEELQPKQVTFISPAPGQPAVRPTDAVAGYVDPLLDDEQRSKLFSQIVELLPHIGKDQTLALSVVRVLSMLTRHQEIAKQLGAKHHLQRLFLMVKQMAGINTEHIQSSFMLILRHISEDEETLRRTMRNSIIESFSNGFRNGNSGTVDMNHFIRSHQASILRSPKLFIEVANEVVELTRFDNDQRNQVLALRKDAVPKTYGPWDSQYSQGKNEDGNEKPSTGEVLQSTENGENALSVTDKGKADVRPPIVERPDGIVHFLLSQLLLYKNVEDKESETLNTKDESPSSSATEGQEMDQLEATTPNDMDNTSTDDQSRPSTARSLRSDKKEDYKAEDHPIYHYRCFLLQCLTELLMSYNQAKIEFINFSRKADPKATTPSKPRSGVLNYLLSDLIPLDQLSRESSVLAMKKQGTSTWAMSVIVALCIKTPETYSRDATTEAKDSDLLFVRRFVIEHAIKAYRDVQSASDLTNDVRYARMLSVSDLFNRILMGRVVALHSSYNKQSGEVEPRHEMYKTQISRIMYEKNLLGVLTSSCSEIDLNVPNAKRAVKYILRPLKTLTFTAIEYSKESDTSTTPGQTTEDDDISTATSVSDISDEREETPDLFRHSALGMLEAARGEQDESDESEDEDEEMYDDAYGDGMDYDDEMDQVDDDEAVSDPDEEDDDMGPIEGRNGDMVMDIEVIQSEPEGDSDGHSDSVSSDDDDDDDDDDESDDDEDMDDIDGDVEIYEEVEAGDGGSLDDEHEHEWRDIDDDEDDDDDDDDDDDHDADLVDNDEDNMLNREADAIISNVFGTDLSGEGANFAALNDDIENGRYMADMRLIRGDDDDDDEPGDEEEEDEFLDDDEADDEEALMFETHDGEDDDEELDVEEAFEFLNATRSARHRHHHHHHHHIHDPHGTFPGAGFSRSGELTFLTTDGRPSSLLHNGMRMHRGNGPVPRGTDEGINPLLARQVEDTNGMSDLHRQMPPGTRFARGIPGLMHAVLGAPLDRGGVVGGLMNAMPDLLSRHGGWAHGGNIMINAALPDDFEMLMGGHDHRGMRMGIDLDVGAPGQRSMGHSKDEVASPPRFTPTGTLARWQEEARMLFPGNAHADYAAHVLNSILKVLAPEAVERDRLRAEEQAKKEAEEAKARAEEEEKKRIAKEKEEKEKAEKDRLEQEEKARQEAERHEREAAQAQAETSQEVGEESMDVDKPDEGESATAATQSEEANPPEAAAPARPRVTTRLRDREVDITDLGIDPEFIASIPEELREEVVMGALQDQTANRAQTGQADTALDPDFLNALPDELREEIIEQERSDRRRREREEARRRDQQAGGGSGPRAEEMDTGNFLATLEPELRRTVLLEDNFDESMLNMLPPAVRREAEEVLAAAGRSRRNGALHGGRHGVPGSVGIEVPWGSSANATQNRTSKHRPIVQMLDKQGIATVLRLLFLPQQGSLRESMNTIFENLAQNRQNRADLISLLLTILQDGSSEPSAVERSFASISIRAKQKEGMQMTPKQLKRTLTGNSMAGTTTSMSSEVTPTLVLTQCLAALVHLSQYVPHVQGFFVNEHETISTLKRKGKGKEKERDIRAQKFALNALLSLLDKKMIMDSATCMEHLSNLLQHVTQPLTILLRKEREEKEREAREKKEKEEKEQAEAEAEAQTGNTQQAGDAPAGQSAADATDPTTNPVSQAADNTGTTVAGAADADAAKTVEDEQSKKEDGKKQRTLVPPVIPESNLRLVVNIITARECNAKIFRETIGIINNLSAIPGAKDVFGKELVKQAQELGENLAYDLTELLAQLNKDKENEAVGSSALSKFSPASSDQTKLLRVLTALDYLFDPKRSNTNQANEGSGKEATQPPKSEILSSLYDSHTFNPVWNRLSDCLKAIRGKENVTNVATILLPLIEALMVVCKNTTLQDSAAALSRSQQFTVTSPEPESSMDTLFFRFTEDHRKILNDLVRNNPRLMSGTFSLLVKNPKVLEFDNKRNYFTRRLHTRDDARRTQPTLQLNVRREEIFGDSYKLLFYRAPEEIKYGKLNIKFNGEEGVDAGGVTREWFQAISREMFNPNYALFVPVASDRTTFHPNRLSHINDQHLSYFKFIGRIIGKAMYEGRPLDCHFSRAVYKRILSRTVSIKDMETLDLDYYKSLQWMLENDIADVLTESFAVENEVFGEIEVVDLIENGRNIPVTDENKHEFVQKVVEYRLTGSIQEQLQAFLQGFHDVIPAELVSIFNEQELELLISGLPEIDIDDWKANTEYHNYNQGSAQISWFWRAVRSFDKEERAKLLQFVTGTSKVPLNGFKELEGMNGFSKFNIHRDYGDKSRLPSSHTCFNQLDLPEYDDYETLRARLYTAMTAGGEYFGFA